MSMVSSVQQEIPTCAPKPVPVFYQGSLSAGSRTTGSPWRKTRAGLAAGRYLKINRGRARVKITTCLPKYPDHQDSIRAGGIGFRQHPQLCFSPRLGALQRPAGNQRDAACPVGSKRKHKQDPPDQRVSYSLRQCAEVNGTL